MSRFRDRARDAYDPERFRADGHAVVDLIADHLAASQRGDGPVMPWLPPEEQVVRFPAEFPVEPHEDDGFLARVLAASTRLHHPRFVGHQVSAPLPAAALDDMVSAMLNNGMAVYEMGPAATAMERAVTDWLAGLVGWAGGAGVLTSGGSAGNLTALLAARQARAGFDAWGEPSSRLAFLVAESTHYSIDRAVRIMGWGRGGAVAVAVDDRYRMRPDALPAALARAQADQRHVVGVVASAGSTATGAYDPLEPIADFCAAHGLWLHVDGAHGAAALLSPSHRRLCAGIERADSLVWDAHKMLMMPALVTAVLFRDGQRGYDAFAQEASYLFQSQAPAQGRSEWWNIGLRTLECTKKMLSLKVYAALRRRGTRFFADYVDETFALAQAFAARIAAAPDFELALPPEGNIVCFRHQPGLSGDALDAHQTRVRKRIIDGGRFYLVQTRLATGVHLRTTLLNPFTTEDDLAALLDEIRAQA